MSGQVLEVLTRQALDAPGRRISFCWQGGEPTLMGLSFFREAVRLQQRYGTGKEIENSLQTNGLLIDAEWAAFLRENGFLVGLSLDGPEHVHDHYRKHRGGAGSWKAVREKARLLLDAEVPVNALTVVNDYSAQFAEEIYRFHQDLGLTWMQFIPCVEPASCSVSGPDYGRFLTTLFDLWWDDLDGVTPATQIRFFDAALRPHLAKPSSLCTQRETCGDYLVVEHDGSVYSCDFYVTAGHRLGSVLEDDLLLLLHSPEQVEFGRAKADRHEECGPCEWLLMCFGGCPKDRRADATGGLSHLCEGYRTFFAHAHDRLAELARHPHWSPWR